MLNLNSRYFHAKLEKNFKQSLDHNIILEDRWRKHSILEDHNIILNEQTWLQLKTTIDIHYKEIVIKVYMEKRDNA